MAALYPCDPALQPASLSLSVDSFLDAQLAAKRQLYAANGYSWICRFFARSACARGSECPYRHSKGDKPYVCKYWVRGLCKKGPETCESLHVYDLSKMPFCTFVAEFGSCTNPDCLFSHTKPDSDTIDCPYYERGFCRHGPNCKNRHTRREMCPDYFTGFCAKGKACDKAHPKWILPEDEENLQSLVQLDSSGHIVPSHDKTRWRALRALVGMELDKKEQQRPPKPVQAMSEIECRYCHEMGHYIGQCPQLPQNKNASASFSSSSNFPSSSSSSSTRDLSSVLCFKCGEHGHYANTCVNPRREPPPGGWPLPPGAKPRPMMDRGTKRPRSFEQQ